MGCRQDDLLELTRCSFVKENLFVMPSKPQHFKTWIRKIEHHTVETRLGFIIRAIPMKDFLYSALVVHITMTRETVWNDTLQVKSCYILCYSFGTWDTDSAFLLLERANRSSKTLGNLIGAGRPTIRIRRATAMVVNSWASFGDESLDLEVVNLTSQTCNTWKHRSPLILKEKPKS